METLTAPGAEYIATVSASIDDLVRTVGPAAILLDFVI